MRSDPVLARARSNSPRSMSFHVLLSSSSLHETRASRATGHAANYIKIEKNKTTKRWFRADENGAFRAISAASQTGPERANGCHHRFRRVRFSACAPSGVLLAAVSPGSAPTFSCQAASRKNHLKKKKTPIGTIRHPSAPSPAKRASSPSPARSNLSENIIDLHGRPREGRR